MNRQRWILTSIVAAGFAARGAAIWLTRPEFVGWFNHSCYYWVQVKGLMEGGRLPYADLPFVFALYGAVAGLFRLIGIGLNPAIVNATRCLMSIVPALIAVPVYHVVKGIHEERLGLPQWMLVAVSAFLPLTLVHMPELLQKNCFGLLFLSGLMLAAYRFLHSRGSGGLVAGLALFGLIAVTHLGTLAAALLFALSLPLAFALERASPRRIGLGSALFLACIGAGLVVLFVLDPEAFHRVALYVRSSLPSSLLGNLFSFDPDIRRPMAALGILVPLALFGWLLWIHRKGRASLPASDRIFWLANTLFAYLLVLPVIDLDLVPRFVLFLPLPTLVILAYALRLLGRGRRGLVLVGLVAVGVTALALGEVMGLILRDPNKEAIQRELLELKASHHLTGRDFVITRYGVNPICNWFLGTRSGLITAFNKNDARSYGRIFVLNPVEGSVVMEGGRGEGTARSGGFREKEAYWTTRRNVSLPDDLRPLVKTEHLSFYELRTLPDGWQFDSDGNWIGMGR